MANLTRANIQKAGFRKRSGANLAEFGPALTVFILLILFPFLNLMVFGSAVATGTFITQQCASQAATASSIVDAVQAMALESRLLLASPLGGFAHLSPVAGVRDSGADLFIIRTDIASGKTEYCGPNLASPTAADKTKYVYEYVVRAHYSIAPFLNLSSIPFIKKVPALGAPTRMRFISQKAAEYPTGIDETSGHIRTGTWILGSIP